MKMLSVGGAGSMEGLRIRRSSVAGDRDMGGLRIKRPSLAGDSDMEGLRIKRLSFDIARRNERRKKLLEELRVVDTGSSKEEKGRKRKSPPPPMEPFLADELTDYMLYEPEKRCLEHDPDFELDRFFPDPSLAAKFIASLKKSSEIWADRLCQFRLNGYATVLPSWELTDDEKED